MRRERTERKECAGGNMEGAQQHSHPSRHRPTRLSESSSHVGSLSVRRSQFQSLRLSWLSWLRGSRLLLFVAVVSGVVLFQLLCAVWLLPASASSQALSALHRSSSVVQLERSRQSAAAFQQSHAGHSHSQHRDDEALRQAVADLQEHIRAHNSDNQHDRHSEQPARNAFEQEVHDTVEGGVKRDSEQQPAQQRQAFEPIDAEVSWK